MCKCINYRFVPTHAEFIGLIQSLQRKQAWYRWTRTRRRAGYVVEFSL